MNIGIVSSFNPYEFKDLFAPAEVPNMNANASSVQALVKSYLDAGHTVWAFTINNAPQYQEFFSERLKVIAVPRRVMRGLSFLRYYDIKYLRDAIRRYIDQLDVIHGQWTYQFSYATLTFAKRIPVFCTVRDWCPYIMSLPMSRRDKPYWYANYYMFKRIMKNENVHLIANSHYTYERIKSAFPQREVVIIPNSIKKEYILSTKTIKVDHIRIITIANGITDYRKNIERLLKAYQLLRKDIPSAELVVVGRYDEDSEVLKEWKDKGYLDHVELTGGKTHDEVIALVDGSSVMVHPALEETFGNTLLESMARRVPVIGGYKSGAVPMVLGNGQYGICCDVTKPEEILKSILLLTDRNVVEDYLDKATHNLIENYASDVVCDKHIQVYSSK